MTNFEGICSFCHCKIENENFEIISHNTIDILKFLSLNLDDSRCHAMCGICSGKLLAAFQFKSTCAQTNAVISPYLHFEKLSQLELRDIYLRKVENKCTIMISEDEKICRLCMHLTGNDFIPLDETDVDAFQRFLPEVNIKTIKDPVFCKSCIDSFDFYSSFMKTFTDVQEGVYTREINSDYSEKDRTSPKLSIKTELNMSADVPPSFVNEFEKIKVELDENELIDIKTEEVKLEVEKDMWSYKLPLSGILPNEVSESEDHSDDRKANTDGIKSETKHQTPRCNEKKVKSGLKRHQFIHKDSSRSRMHKYDACGHEIKFKSDPENPVQLHKCTECDYKTKYRSDLKKHEVIHHNPFPVPTHKCDICDYRTKYKSNLNKHHRIHSTDPPQQRMYECYMCKYKAKQKHCLAQHVAKHIKESQLEKYGMVLEDPSPEQVYGCYVCGYKTKYKGDLRKHELIHKDPSEVQMHRCDVCGFETKFKRSLKIHQLKHKDRSQVKLYKCDYCDFESKIRNTYKRHQLIHKDPSQVEMYKCEDCAYQTRLKQSLKSHKLIHKDPSQVQMYKCDICGYETKFHYHLVKHFMKHKDPTQVQMYKCKVCDFESKHKSSLLQHNSLHRDPSAVQLHECGICSYKTRFKQRLKRHKLIHSPPAPKGNWVANLSGS